MIFYCKKCSRSIKNKGALIRHENLCDGSGTKRDKRKIPSLILECPKCHYKIKGKGNQKSHLLKCSGEGPLSSIKRRSGGKCWLKGKSYKDVYGEIKSNNIKNKISEKNKVVIKNLYIKNPEYRNKLSKSLKGKTGGYRIGGGRGKGCWYESPLAGKVYLDSTWELAYSKWLDKNMKKWKKNYIKFPYEFQGKLRYYIPDFYLIDSDEYIEIKGYKTEKDLEKWKSFPYKLTILMKEELKKLDII